MIEANIVFTKRKGRKKFPMILSNQETVKTVFQQFVLSLPIGIESKKLVTHSMNGFVFNSDQSMSYLELYQAFIRLTENYANKLNMLIISKAPIEDDNVNLSEQLGKTYIYLLKAPIAQQKNTKKKSKKPVIASHDMSYDDIIPDLNELIQAKKEHDRLLSNSVYHLLIKYYGLAQESQDEDFGQALHDIKKIKNFNNKKYKKISNNIEHLLASYHALDDGKRSSENAEHDAIEINYELRDKLAQYQEREKEEKVVSQYFKSNFSPYVTTQDNTIEFIEQLLQARNSPQVKSITNNSNDNLLKSIIALAKLGLNQSKERG